MILTIAALLVIFGAPLFTTIAIAVGFIGEPRRAREFAAHKPRVATRAS